MLKILFARFINWMFPLDGEKFHLPVKSDAIIFVGDTMIHGVYYTTDGQNGLSWFEAEWIPEELADRVLDSHGLRYNYHAKLKAKLSFTHSKSLQVITKSVHVSYSSSKTVCAWDMERGFSSMVLNVASIESNA